MIPNGCLGEDRIKFNLNNFEKGIFRIYIESTISKITVFLYKQKINSKENYKLVNN